MTTPTHAPAPTQPPAAMSPTLSVIVPVYNAPAELQRCLAALAASRYGHFDVLVIDDGSTAPVEAVVTAYGFRSLRLDGPGGQPAPATTGPPTSLGSMSSLSTLMSVSIRTRWNALLPPSPPIRRWTL